MRRSILVFILLLPIRLSAQDIYNDCGMAGDAKNANVRELNQKKNRYEAPKPTDYNSQVTLQAILEPGDDEARWSDTQAAEITGYVHDVKLGGIESCNCHAKDKLYRDTHIELVLDLMNAERPNRVIAEVTPRWRAIMKAKGIDWTTNALRKSFLGKWVQVKGWLLFDEEHKNASENINPGGPKNWRATAWEIHPITSIEVVERQR